MGYLGKKNSMLMQKILFTFIMVGLYIIGRELPLYMIDVSYYYQQQVDSEMLLLKVIGGDIQQSSVFALGISPYIMSSLIVMIINAFKSTENKKKTSQVRTSKQILNCSLILSLVLAIVRIPNMHFRNHDLLWLTYIVVIVEMIAGAMLIIRMVSINKKYGIGGQSAFILVNITEGLFVTIKDYGGIELIITLGISIIAIFLMLFMENSEKRIPLQRISIHSIYADKNYLAIKVSPIGVMPVMFSMAVFLLIKLLVELVLLFAPESTSMLWARENIEMTKPAGMVFYVLVIYVLSIGFSRVFLHPGETAEQYLKSGDSLQNIRAGKETKKYLSRTVTSLAFVSATVMAVSLCVPMLMQFQGLLDETLATLPMRVMMLAGIWSNFYREILAIKDLDAYEIFI